jgi:protein disulfide-isomerase
MLSIQDEGGSMRLARQFLPVLLLIFVQRAAFGEQAINWEGTIEGAKATAARSNRFVLLFFTANWCPNCHRLENDLRNQPGAAAALEANFVPVKLNYDYFQNTAKQYGVTRLPTTIVLAPTASGEVLVVIPEAMAVDQYLLKLNKVATDARQRAAGVYAQIPVNPAVGSAAMANPLRANEAPMPPTYGAAQPTVPVQPMAAPVPVSAAVPTNVPAAGASASGPATAMPAGPAVPSNRPMPSEQAPAAARPSLALDGYCPVQLVETGRWQKGDKAWGMIHRGRLYLFVGTEEQRRFQANPDRYAPVSSGNDVVLAVDVGREVPGFREHGAQYDGHVYLFASEATLKKFESNPLFYADRALQSIRPAAQTSTMR